VKALAIAKSSTDGHAAAFEEYGICQRVRGVPIGLNAAARPKRKGLSETTRMSQIQPPANPTRVAIEER